MSIFQWLTFQKQKHQLTRMTKVIRLHPLQGFVCIKVNATSFNCFSLNKNERPINTYYFKYYLASVKSWYKLNRVYVIRKMISPTLKLSCVIIQRLKIDTIAAATTSAAFMKYTCLPSDNYSLKSLKILVIR